MTVTDIITDTTRPMTADELEERQFFRRLRWGLAGLYLVTLIGAVTIFVAGYFTGAAGWGL